MEKIKFKIESPLKLKLDIILRFQHPQTMKLLGSTENEITKDKNW